MSNPFDTAPDGRRKKAMTDNEWKSIQIEYWLRTLQKYEDDSLEHVAEMLSDRAAKIDIKNSVLSIFEADSRSPGWPQ